MTAELGEKMAVPLAPFNSPSALSTVPLIPYTATGNTVREDGAKIYSLYGTAYTELIRRDKMIRLGHTIMLKLGVTVGRERLGRGDWRESIRDQVRWPGAVVYIKANQPEISGHLLASILEKGDVNTRAGACLLGDCACRPASGI